MVALQEEIDWLVYEALPGLLTDEDKRINERAREEALPGILRDPSRSRSTDDRRLWPGHRPFEVVLARDCLASGAKTSWFKRNGYGTPSEIDALYSQAYRQLIEARIAIIDRNPRIRLIEKPEYKRRWTLTDYGNETRSAVKDWLLSAVERRLTKADRPLQVRALGEEILAADPNTREVVLCLYDDEQAFLEALPNLVAEESVPLPL